MSKIIKCRTISEGYGEGEAIVTQMAFGFNHAVDFETGRVKEIGHELEGESIKGKVFIFPKAKGSTGGSCYVYQLGLSPGSPAAVINLSTETIVAVGAILCEMPVVDRLEEDLFENIQTGDYVKVDATNGFIEIFKKGERTDVSN